MQLNVSDIASCLRYDKQKLINAIEKLGREEIITRYCWHTDTEDRDVINNLITKFLNDDWVDDRGTPLGQYFWGDL